MRALTEHDKALTLLTALGALDSLYSGCWVGQEWWLCESSCAICESQLILEWSSGLALESVIVILTPRFMPFFLLLWVIGKGSSNILIRHATTFYPVNVAAAQWPPVLLPSIFRYAYGSPFYSISMGSRTIIFGIKNNCKDLILYVHWHVLIGISGIEFRHPHHMDRNLMHNASHISVDRQEKGQSRPGKSE